VSCPVPVKRVSVTFTFSDGTSSARSSGGLSLKPGQSTAISTGPADQLKCVKRTHMFIEVGTKTIWKSDTANQCQAELDYRIDAKSIGARSYRQLSETERMRVMESVEATAERSAEAAPD
jgi:hypothetical protein